MMSENNDQIVAIIGLGYVGLPLAIELSTARTQVVGYDINSGVVTSLNSGTSHIGDVGDGDLENALNGMLSITDNEDDLRPANTFIVCVPTPLDRVGEPDLRAVLAAGGAVSRNLSQGDLVILESTTYPGTTEGIFREELERSGFRAGEDFHLAFSPERIDPGNTEFSLKNTPKVVGGLTQQCGERASLIYQRIVERVINVSSPREAELAKLIENTYRHVNIALVNEIAILADRLGINVWESINAASSKPFGFQAFYPGPGVGGHCIPIDPQYLAHAAKTVGSNFRFAALASEVNSQMHRYIVRRIQDLLNESQKALNGSRVLLLGMSYKANISDLRESPSLHIAELLKNFGADVLIHDPFHQRVTVGERTISCEPHLPSALEEADVSVLLQAHSEYNQELLTQHSRQLLDCRGLFGLSKGSLPPNIETL